MTKQEYYKNTVESVKPMTPGNVSQKNCSHEPHSYQEKLHNSLLLSKSKLSTAVYIKHGHTLCFSCTRDFLEFPQSSLVFSRPKNQHAISIKTRTDYGRIFQRDLQWLDASLNKCLFFIRQKSVHMSMNNDVHHLRLCINFFIDDSVQIL